MTDLSDFNTYAREYGARMFLVAGRVFDLAPDNWEKLSCMWYQQHGLLELPNDRYIGKLPNGQEAVRYHSVDELALNPPKELAGIGQHIYDGWMAKKVQLAKIRNADPIVILPPQEPPMWEPKPQPKPVELPPKQELPKEPQKPIKIQWKLIATILAAVGFALKFTPVPAAVILAIDWLVKILQAIPQ
jgi:hypothetical protein